MTLLQTLDLTVHDLDRFFDEIQFVVNLDPHPWYRKRSSANSILNFKTVKRTITLLNFSGGSRHKAKVPTLAMDLKGPNITRVQLSPCRNGIALLTITGSLDMALDLNYSLGCLVDDLWASELTVPNFSPADG
ncbi:hypothetical protein Tco_0916507 [Tanacetum coccineum]